MFADSHRFAAISLPLGAKEKTPAEPLGTLLSSKLEERWLATQD
jgi:hypothetical protein